MAAIMAKAVAESAAQVQATLHKYKARVHQSYSDGKVAYSSPSGWLVVRPLARGRYEIEFHQRAAKCPCEA